MESVEEEVFEVQTLQPFHGWAFERFCDRSGNTFPQLTRAAQRATARDDKLLAAFSSTNSNGTSAPLEIGALPNAEWMWSHDWLPDDEYTQCDEEGWTYGSTIARINRRLAEGTSVGKREYYHFVRRRRWIRTRVRKPPTTVALTAVCSKRLSALSIGCRSVSSNSSSSDSSNDSDDERSRSHTTDPTLMSPKRFYRVYRDSVFAHFHVRAAAAPSTTLTHQTQHEPHFHRVEFTDDDVQLEGWLGQRGTFSRSWKLRYCLLRRDTSTFVCLRDRASLVQICEEPIDRHTSVIAENSPNPQQFQFLIVNRDRQLRLNAVDAPTRATWLSALSELIVQSRASFFFAGDESDGTVTASVRSRTFRRMPHLSIDVDDETSSYNPNTSGGGFFHTGGVLNPQPPLKKKARRRAWRPYKLVSATMHSRVDTDRLRRFDYFERFRRDVAHRLEVLETFVEASIVILEENLAAAEQLLSSAVACVPTADIATLRAEVHASLAAFATTVEQTLAQPQANVLSCNHLARDLFVLANNLHERVLSFAPPVAQATIKKVLIESPANKRRIPEDWFTEPRDYEKPQPLAGSAMRRSSTATSLSRSLPDAKMSVNGASASRFSTSSLSGSEPIRIKPYSDMPAVLNDGHFELPSGVNDYVIKVHDKDLGALIAYSLCSKTYVDELESHFSGSVNIAHELAAEERDAFVNGISEQPKAPAPPPTTTRAIKPVRVSLRRQQLYLHKMRSSDVQHTDMKFAYDVSTTTQHSIRCVAFFAAQFHALRALTEPGNVQFLNSIAESRRWDTSGGKSGAFFSMSHDKRYVLKGISLTESNMFLQMAPHYFKFMAHVLENASPTLMTKILGLFKLSHARRLHKQTTYVVVMENLAFGCSHGQMYDIKGILRRRYHFSDSDSDREDDDEEDEQSDMSRRIRDSRAADVLDRYRSVGGSSSDATATGATAPHAALKLPVLLDGNLAERIPIPVRQSDLDVLDVAIQNDTGFLCRAGVIDYSVLMLFDEERREVVLGLIDYLHQYDFLKKMESTSKASLTFRNPTVVRPVSYRRRFVNAMHRYLVGIEQELELRMRKRCFVGTSARSSNKLPAALTDGSGGMRRYSEVGTAATMTGTTTTSPSDRQTRRQTNATDASSSLPPSASSPSLLEYSADMASATASMSSSSNHVDAGGGNDSNAPTSTSSFAESVASVVDAPSSSCSNAAVLSASPQRSLDDGRTLHTCHSQPPPFVRMRSHSHESPDGTSYDFVAGKAHSDGEDFSSTSSDDNCLTGSQAILDAMLPEFS